MRVYRSETLLTDTNTNQVLGNALAFDGDVSLSALFRAIVINHNINASIADIAANSQIRRLRAGTTPDVESIMRNALVPMIIVECGNGISSVDPKVEGWDTYDSSPFYLNRYLSQFQKSKVYTNAMTHQVVAIVDKRITHTWVQAFESMLWGVLSWYYPSKSDETVAFFKQLSVKAGDENGEEAKKVLIQYVNEIAQKIDFRKMRLHQLLDNIANAAKDAQISARMDNIADINDRIEACMRSLESEYARLEEERTILTALEARTDDKDNSVFEFFDSHKNINVDNVDDTTITYTVHDTLEYYDEDELKRLFNNHNSWAYTRSDDVVTYVKALLLEKRGIIHVCATFKLSNLSLVSPIKGAWNVPDAMPNPHIYNFACSGANAQYYSKYAKTGDWDLGVEQSISATKNWSVGDSTVGRSMFSWLSMNDYTPCIYVTDGSPIDRVTDDMKIVTFDEFKKLVDAVRTKESEGVNNG